MSTPRSTPPKSLFAQALERDYYMSPDTRAELDRLCPLITTDESTDL